MNSTKLLIAVAVLFLGILSAQAQSILEGLVLEAAVSSSILQEQGGSDILMANALVGSDTSASSINTVFLQTSIAPNAGQPGQVESSPEFNNNGSSPTEFDDISFPNVVTTPEPSSFLLFGVDGLAVAFYKGKRGGKPNVHSSLGRRRC